MIIVKTGTEVHFRRPIKKTYQVETSDKKLAIGIALDRGKSCYPSLKWDNPIILTSEYKYKEIANLKEFLTIPLKN